MLLSPSATSTKNLNCCCAGYAVGVGFWSGSFACRFCGHTWNCADWRLSRTRFECLAFERNTAVYLRPHTPNGAADFGCEICDRNCETWTMRAGSQPQLFRGMSVDRGTGFGRAVRVEQRCSTRGTLLHLRTRCDLCRERPRMREYFRAAVYVVSGYCPIARHAVGLTAVQALPSLNGVEPGDQPVPVDLVQGHLNARSRVSRRVRADDSGLVDEDQGHCMVGSSRHRGSRGHGGH